MSTIISFQLNTGEYLILGLILTVITISSFLPIRFTVSHIVYFLVFNLFLGVVVDQILSVPPYDLYDVLTPKFTVGDMIIYLFLYPPTVYIFLVLADILGTHRKKLLIGLLIVYSLLTLLMEWILSKYGVYKYKGWNYYLSGVSYVVLYSLNLFVWYLVKYRTKRYRQ